MSDSTSRWQLEKRINLGDVFSTLMLVGTLALFMINLDKRISIVEEKQTQQAMTDATQNERMREMNIEVKGELKEIGGKLDKLVDRQLDVRK